MFLGQKSIYSFILKVNQSSAAVTCFLCTHMLIPKPEILELPRELEWQNKHFVAYRKAVFRIHFLKMHLLFGTVALWAWVHGSCVRVTEVESLHRPCYYFVNSFALFLLVSACSKNTVWSWNLTVNREASVVPLYYWIFPIFESCT